MIKATKTINPLHFEDLEPHRFEDLVRQLIYDFREWQSIEATGRSGSDEGFDIRAWEKVKEITNKDEEEENTEGRHLLEGNTWMIQCKREKSIGPSRLKKIIKKEINKNNLPYGYILVAPANFSKKSYDTFREELRGRGVSEFYLWGRAELEDMLYMPKNDRILFTFFSISLATRRKSRASEIRFIVNNKNKLMRTTGVSTQPNQEISQSVLVRDSMDIHYPYKDQYTDFDKHKRWREHIAYAIHPLGLLIHIRKYYAYLDIKKNLFDFTEEIDLINRKEDQEDKNFDYMKKLRKVEDFWKHMPRKNQAKFLIDGLISFENMLVIDDKGDSLYEFLHIFVDFKNKKHPFDVFFNKFEYRSSTEYFKKGYKRIKFFPKKFPDIKNGTLYEEKTITWDEETLRLFRNENYYNKIDTLFDVNGTYNFLKPRDIILVSGMKEEDSKKYIEITHKYSTTMRDYLKQFDDFYKERVKRDIERQVGRSIKVNEKLNIFEFEAKYNFEVKPRT